MKTVITANEGLRGGKKIALKNTVDKALEQCPEVENVFVYHRTDADTQMKEGRDINLEEVNGYVQIMSLIILVTY